MNQPKRERYARLNRLGVLKNVDVSDFSKCPLAVIGLGNLGGQVIHHLGLMGFPLRLIDHGMVKKVNLGTQGFLPEELGKPKVTARTDYLRRLNPECSITSFHEDISILGAGKLAGAKIIFGCLDSWFARSVVHEMAWELGIPLVDGGLDGSGERFLGRVSVIDPRRQENPCLFCSWDQEMFRKVRTETEAGNSCPEIRLGPKQIKAQPTLMPSSIGGVVAGIMVTQALKLLFNPEQISPASFEIIADLSANRFLTVELQTNSYCVFPHQTIPVERLPQKGDEVGVGELFDYLQKQFKSDIRISLHRKEIAPQLVCENGHFRKDVYRIIETVPPKKKETLCACGLPLLPIPQQLMKSFDKKMARHFSGKTWSELGISEEDILTVSDGKKIKRVLFS